MGYTMLYTIKNQLCQAEDVKISKLPVIAYMVLEAGAQDINIVDSSNNTDNFRNILNEIKQTYLSSNRYELIGSYKDNNNKNVMYLFIPDINFSTIKIEDTNEKMRIERTPTLNAVKDLRNHSVKPSKTLRDILESYRNIPMEG